MLAALAEGESRLLAPLRSEDTVRLRHALATVGAGFREEGGDLVAADSPEAAR